MVEFGSLCVVGICSQALDFVLVRLVGNWLQLLLLWFLLTTESGACRKEAEPASAKILL